MSMCGGQVNLGVNPTPSPMLDVDVNRLDVNPLTNQALKLIVHGTGGGKAENEVNLESERASLDVNSVAEKGEIVDVTRLDVKSEIVDVTRLDVIPANLRNPALNPIVHVTRGGGLVM